MDIGSAGIGDMLMENKYTIKQADITVSNKSSTKQ